jgi:DNA repair exonuclease SbcCD ATPase subunit
LARDPQIEESERICLISTYEFAIVKRENLGRLIKALREFPANDTSLKEQAAVLEGWLNDDESDSLTAIAWNQCSVCGDSWHNYHYDKEKGCSYSYRLYEDNIHVYVFDELEESLKAIRKTSNQRRELLQSLKDLRDTYEDYAEYKRFQVSSGFRVSEYDEEVYPAMIEVYEEVIKDLEEIIAQEEGE